MSQTPPTIDMGDRLPLRSSVRPGKRIVLHMLLWTTVFLLVPICYLADQPQVRAQPLRELLPLIGCMTLGAMFLLVAVLAIVTKASWRIDDQLVHVSVRGVLRRSNSHAPRSEYTALLTPRDVQPGFFGDRTRYQIILWHREDPTRQVVLYAGPSEARFRNRLATYERMFGLPVDPPGLVVVPVP